MLLLIGASIYLKDLLIPQKLKPQIIPEFVYALAIKGCLFDLGIHQSDVKVDNSNITVTSSKRFTQDEILEAFKKLGNLGATVQVEGNEKVHIYTDRTKWHILFKYPPPVKYPPKRISHIAIIIDDMGQNMDAARELGNIAADLTFSILPEMSYSKESAIYLHKKGKEVLLHLPLEGRDGKNPGPGAIYSKMTLSEIRILLVNHLSNVPYISGVNNHMGSVITQDKTIMTIIAKELKQRNMFYIDSLTTNKSICKKVAEELDIPFASRDIFLDNNDSYAYISHQLEKLVVLGEKNSRAIGICHPRPTTIEVLKKEIPRLKDQGVIIEPVSSFAHEW